MKEGKKWQKFLQDCDLILNPLTAAPGFKLK